MYIFFSYSTVQYSIVYVVYIVYIVYVVYVVYSCRFIVRLLVSILTDIPHCPLWHMYKSTYLHMKTLIRIWIKAVLLIYVFLLEAVIFV